MSAADSLAHIDQYGEANLDGTTLRHLRNFAIGQRAKDARIRAEVVAAGGEQLAVDEWDSVFAEDDRQRVTAIERIEAELIRRFGSVD